MPPLPNVNELLDTLRAGFSHDAFAYSTSDGKFTSVASAHFSMMREKRYGVYIIRRSATGEILYIGKGGTLDQQGKVKGQDIPGRLSNTKGKHGVAKYASANLWFSALAEEKGQLEIEYIITWPKLAPAYVEAVLLQAYRDEHACLPLRNRAF